MKWILSTVFLFVFFHLFVISTQADETTGDCSDFANNETACCDAKIGCLFYNCTVSDKNITSFCVQNTTDERCESGHLSKGCEAQPITTPAPSPTTASPTTSTPTPSPTTTPHTGGGSGQSFDAASFIGGIILCGGLVAIGYFGLKFYRARQEQNYHTL